MQNGHNLRQKARFYGSVAALYVPTLLFAWYLLHPFGFSPAQPKVLAYSPISALPLAAQQKITYGQPVRIIIKQASNGLDIDLPIDTGSYDSKTNSWTLSDTHAEYADLSALPNDTMGTTLIYGHNNPHVFGYLSAIHANAEAYAEIYTANGHVFTYHYDNTKALRPDDTSVFDPNGPPVLVVQTCSGSFFEYRQMFRFELRKVDGKDV